MSSVTAIIAIGSMHPNDGCINPSHIALLHEGNRAAWTLHDLSEHPEARRKWMPESPELIAPTLVNEILPLCNAGAISATLVHNSSLRTADLQALTEIDVEINHRTWSRIFSAWTNDWRVVDTKVTPTNNRN